MAEDSGQRGLLPSLMALLRPGGGVSQLLLLKAGKIAAGQMQQIAREFDNLRALAVERFVNQIIVIAVTVAFVQAHHAVGVPAAVAHKAAKKIVAAGDAVYRPGFRRGQHAADGLRKLRGNALVGIDHQHIVAGGVVLGALTLNAVALPVAVDMYLNTQAAGEFNGVIAAAGIQQYYLIGPAYRGQTIRQQIRRIFGDHHDREARRHQWLRCGR